MQTLSSDVPNSQTPPVTPSSITPADPDFPIEIDAGPSNTVSQVLVAPPPPPVTP